MKISHFSDLHYSPGHHDESDRCFRFAVGDAIAQSAAVGVISGDATDHRLDAHAPALHALAAQIHRLAEAMPVLMLQGTYSHEPPGTLSNFAFMGSTHDVYVADRVVQVALIDGRFVASTGPVLSEAELQAWIELDPAVVFTCLPTLNKGQLAVEVGSLAAATGMGDLLTEYLTSAGRVNLRLRAAGIRTVGVSHGTVNGCTTEHGVTMAGFDHEFSVGTLFEAQCDAFMLGHIHKHQQWTLDGRCIAYPGSIGRFHYGEEGDKGYLLWDVSPGSADATLIPTPSRQMLTVDFDGPPDMAQLAELAAQANGKFVRVRWQIDEEHRQMVDREAIQALFAQAAGLKIEPRILPVVRSRAAGISQETSLERKLERWCELTEVKPEPIVDRLGLLALGDSDAIVDAVLARLEQAPEAADPIASLQDEPATGMSLTALVAPVEVETASSVEVKPVDATVPDTPAWLTDDLFA